MAYKGPVPKGQPRTLRSIVEGQAGSKNLQSSEFDGDQTAKLGTYKDDVGTPSFEGRREGAATKRPF